MNFLSLDNVAVVLIALKWLTAICKITWRLLS